MLELVRPLINVLHSICLSKYFTIVYCSICLLECLAIIDIALELFARMPWQSFVLNMF